MPTISSRTGSWLVAVTLAGLACVSASRAFAEADGPDAWRVTGVAADDELNARMGPGVGYPAIDALAPGARHLTSITCVPLATLAQYEALSAGERRALPPRWCLVSDGTGRQRGWVAQRFLAEDTLAPDAAIGAGGEGPNVPPPWDIAVPLVRNLYASYAVAGADAFRDVDWARAYFFLDLAQQLARGPLGADPLYGGQDADISDVRVMFDREAPVVRGMATVIVTFRNFGEDRRAALSLRADPQQGGAIRIFRIEHQDGHTVP